ncbi:MAG: YkgJ family cysteine cluster protein [Sulfuriferula sp.]|nr:YkgJ family cysteine cluster protein [Sulfuriferula sp.]
MNRNTTEDGALDFFKAQHQAFTDTLALWRGKDDMVPALLAQSYSSFEGNVAVQAQGQPALACHKGCATCCTMRVIATAPEVLMAARYIRAADTALKQAGIDLPQRIADADIKTRGCDESQRMKQRRHCPFIAKGRCVIYPVRPLACRGHASHDKRACIDVAAGRRDSVPISMPHMMVRSLIQNAMQSALRDASYVWAAYELNHALTIALEDESCESAWRAGADVFAAAAVSEISLVEMAETFDRIHAG